MAKSGRVRVIRRVVSAALLGVVLYWVARTEGVAELPSRLARLEPRFVALAVLLPFVAVASGVRRWQLLLAHEGIRLPFTTLLGSFLRGRFVGAFTPSTTGLDLYRLVDVASRTGARAASGRAILVEKLHGLVALSLVTFALLPAGLARFFGPAGLALAGVLGVTSIAGLVLVARPNALRALAARMPKKVRGKATELAEALASAPPTPRLLCEVAVLGVVSHAATATIFVATGLALGVSASPFTLLVVGNAIVLATLLPISVGGVGVREGTAVALLALVGVGAAEATLVGLLGYCVAQPPAIVGGLSELFGRRAPSLA
ncbi:MAG: flippase-like domain-containing protein [Sandaracinus sp.]|nr:flippase-like domain-containing protein [Myxococcales bacterium]MCB9599617.1 flippase-like domain-containing protein [Sandaracinus sp.]MCB9612152.1 flippase-like domain-containing protein [Sandaracinus sp.]